MGKQGKIKKMSEALKVYSVQNIQHPFETLWEERSNLLKIFGQMARIPQKVIIIFIKNLLKNTTLCGYSNA